MSSSNIKKMTTVGVLCAIAYVIMFFVRIPVVPAFPFLRYDPKDVIIIFGGFLYGPISAVIISVIVSVLEMLTATDTLIWGCIANILSSCTLVCTASIIYGKRKTLGGAIIGLTAGVILMTGIMALWNYIAIPIYTRAPRPFVASLLLPVFIPFNLFKGCANAVLAMLLFKPVVVAMHRARIIEPAIEGTRSTKMKWIFVAAGTVIAAVLFYFIYNYKLGGPPA